MRFTKSICDILQNIKRHTANAEKKKTKKKMEYSEKWHTHTGARTLDGLVLKRYQIEYSFQLLENHSNLCARPGTGPAFLSLSRLLVNLCSYFMFFFLVAVAVVVVVDVHFMAEQDTLVADFIGRLFGGNLVEKFHLKSQVHRYQITPPNYGPSTKAKTVWATRDNFHSRAATDKLQVVVVVVVVVVRLFNIGGAEL